MFYDLSSPSELQLAQARFDFLANKQKKINLTESRKKRTYQQNRYLHLLLGWFGVETGYSLNEAKQIYKKASADIYLYEKKGRPFMKSSAELDTKELSITIERFRNYSNIEAGIYLPSANETELLNHIERELGKYENKVYI